MLQDPEIRADLDLFNGMIKGQSHYADKKMLRQYCQRKMDESFLGLEHVINFWPPWRKYGCVEQRLRKEFVAGKVPQGFVRTTVPLELNPGNARSLSARV
jgi:hypothetical protein